MRRAGEDRVHGGRERADELAEGAVVLEVVAPFEPVVLRHRALDLHACLHEGDPVADRQRQPERIGLHAAAGEHRRADREPHHAARDGHRLQPALAGHPIDERAGRGKEVRAEVEPVVPSDVRAHAPAEPVAGLQQQHIAVT